MTHQLSFSHCAKAVVAVSLSSLSSALSEAHEGTVSSQAALQRDRDRFVGPSRASNIAASSTDAGKDLRVSAAGFAGFPTSDILKAPGNIFRSDEVYWSPFSAEHGSCATKWTYGEDTCQSALYKYLENNMNMSSYDVDNGRRAFRLGALQVSRTEDLYVRVKIFTGNELLKGQDAYTECFDYGYFINQNRINFPDFAGETVENAMRDALGTSSWTWKEEDGEGLSRQGFYCVDGGFCADDFTDRHYDPAKPTSAAVSPSAHILKSNFSLFEKQGKVFNSWLPGGSEVFLPSLSLFDEEDGCYVACYANGTTSGVYGLDNRFSVVGQIRLQGSYQNGECFPGEGLQVDEHLDLADRCRENFAACERDSCWVGGQTGGWFGLYGKHGRKASSTNAS